MNSISICKGGEGVMFVPFDSLCYHYIDIIVYDLFPVSMSSCNNLVPVPVSNLVVCVVILYHVSNI